MKIRFYQILTLIVFFAAALSPIPVASAAGTNLSISRFDPTPAGDRFFGVDSALVDGHLELDADLTLDWAHDPLVLHSASDNHTVVAVVSNQVFADLGLALQLWHRLQISVDVPVAVYQSGPNPAFGTFAISSPNGAHLGDLRAGARVRLLSAARGLFNLSLGGFIWLPLGSSTSNSGAFVSDGFVRGRLEVLSGGERGRFFWSADLAGDLRRAQTFLNVSQGSMFRATAGVGVLLLAKKQLQIGPEANFDLGLPKVQRYNTNLEILGGIRYHFLNHISIGAAAGPGLSSGVGTPDFRAVATLGYGHEFAPPPAPAPIILPPLEPATEPIVIPPASAPASEPETQPAPPADRDGDGIIDDEDACPDQPGKASADAKQNGCPSGAVVNHQIAMLEPVRFKTASAKILPRSDEILHTVLTTILAQPADTRFIVEGHTDSRGNAASNRKLSFARAKSVVRWMAAHGVDAKRFDAKGFGPDRPLVANDSERGREINRRVEIHIAQ